MSRYVKGLSKGAKISIAVAVILAVAVIAFFISALIVGQQNGLTCIEQIQAWFGVVKDAVVETPVEDVVETAKIIL